MLKPLTPAFTINDLVKWRLYVRPIAELGQKEGVRPLYVNWLGVLDERF